MQLPAPGAEVLTAWRLSGARLSWISSGHINLSFRIDHVRGRFILQRLNPIFSPEIHHDIEAVTARLETQGLRTPRLLRTEQGDLWTADAEGKTWRVMTFIEGESFLMADSPERCREAGRLLGEFHRALWDWEYVFRHNRFGVHDTKRHLGNLERTLGRHAAHPRFHEVEVVAGAIQALAGGLDLERILPGRIVHGDPKISNVIFDPAGGAICFVDLDTLARMSIPVELGDAFRSWANPDGEDAEDAEAALRLTFFEAGLRGYASAIGNRLGAEERAAIPALTLQIAVELAARFCADALEESYFGWDSTRFSSAADHNLKRARSQLALARSIRDQLAAMGQIVTAAWERSTGVGEN